MRMERVKKSGGRTSCSPTLASKVPSRSSCSLFVYLLSLLAHVMIMTPSIKNSGTEGRPTKSSKDPCDEKAEVPESALFQSGTQMPHKLTQLLR